MLLAQYKEQGRFFRLRGTLAVRKKRSRATKGPFFTMSPSGKRREPPFDEETIPMRSVVNVIFWMVVGGALSLYLEHHTTFWHGILAHRVTIT
jgi:hypothetical protein